MMVSRCNRGLTSSIPRRKIEGYRSREARKGGGLRENLSFIAGEG
jgi:hypothetical protein